MKKKRLLSLALAVTMLFGSAAAMPEGVFTENTSITASAYEEYGDFKYWVRSDDYDSTRKNVEICRYTGDGGKVVIPDTIEGYPVEGISSYAFDHNDQITSVVIPDSVTCISSPGFACCKNLREINIPRNLKNLCSYAFQNCEKLESKIVIPGCMETVPKNVFMGCSKLKEVVISDGIKCIGDSAFWGCESISSITIPDSVTTIESYAFSSCTNLETVVMSKSITNIEANPFARTKWLSNQRNQNPLVIINNILIDGHNCTGNVEIPNTVTSISSGAFATELVNGYIYACKIKSVTIPESVKSIGDYAFNDSYIEEAIIKANIPIIDDGIFNECNLLKSVSLPNGITSIGENAFNCCYNLTAIEIPESVKTIGNKAFYYCKSLTDVTIPNSVTEIGNESFTSCESLVTVTVPKTVNSIGYSAFSYCPNVTLLVNKGSYAEQYAKYNNIKYEYIEDAGDSQFSITTDVEFRYGNYGDPVRDYSFHYSDAMLVGKDANANNESGDIAVFSANLSVAAYEKDTILKCLKTMGFKSSNIKYAETYDFKPTYKDNDRVAYTIAYKKVNGKHLFVVPIRGTHGNCEWFSDFNLGTGKNHAGFYAAAKRVRTTLISEMKNRNADSSNTVLYFTGHSRGAAVANILAGEFSTSGFELEGYNVNVPANHIFAYTYACPAVSRALTSKDTALKNIYNYINPGDLIPALPLEEKGWDYKRYGRKITYEMSGDSFCDFLHRFYDFYTNEDGEKQAYQGVKDTDKLIEVFKTLASTPAEFNQKSTRAVLDATLIKIKMLNDDPKYIPTTIGDIEQQIANKYNLSLTEIYKSAAKIIRTLGTALSPRMVLSGITVFNLKKAITHGHTGETYVKWTEAKYNTRKDITHKFSSFTSGFLAALGYSTNKCTICGKEVVINYQPGAISNAVKNAGKDLDLTFHRCDEDDKTYGLFKGVEVDGNTVDPSNYSTKSGSLKLTLDKSFVSKLSAGTHTVKVLFKDGFSETSIFVAENANEPTVDRLAGKGRYETATKISSKAYGFETASTVVLAYGLNYADALAGVSLAKAMNAPILLTNLKTLPNETLVEIKRLGASNVIILGGTGAVGEEVEKILKENNLNVERIAGKTRFETATKIAQKMQKLNDNKAPKEVFFVYAFNSADALSVSAVAALKNAPIIYLTTKGDLNADTAAYLAKLKKTGSVKNAYVIGGSGVISDDMMKKAGKALGVTPTRVFGKDRFATCVAVNEKFADVLDGDSICVATGMDFPDALAGGVYAAINKAPLFLVNGKLKTPKLTDEQKAYLKAKSAAKITAFGGVGVVPDNHITDIVKNSI